MKGRSIKKSRSASPFRFQQFTVRDDQTAMKIGTDGVLLGAWTPIREARTVLDVGTGCGLVSLMIAQRTAMLGSHVSAIDIDADASAQAVMNFQESPWSNRLPGSVKNVHLSFQEFAAAKEENSFDLVVSNPPFFEPASEQPVSARRIARTTRTLDQRLLFELSQNVLKKSGRFCLILPYEQADRVINCAVEHGFTLWTKIDVRPTPTSRLKRVLFEFGLSACVEDVQQGELVIEESRHQYTKDYERLTKEFHLRYAAK